VSEPARGTDGQRTGEATAEHTGERTDGQGPPADLRGALAAAATRLAEAGVPSAWADAQALAAHTLGVSRAELARLIVLGGPAPEGLPDLVARRAAREPLQHITGRASFRRLDLRVGPGVFIPRPETEVVAGIAIEEARASAHPVVVDLCTGSGAIALAVADEVPAARVVAVEVDPAAHAWAARNVAAAGGRVDLRLGDVADRRLTGDLDGAVDVVVANPPYIPPDGTPVDLEVSLHDPPLALYGGGDDGLSVPREVVAAAHRLLRPGGLLVMEHAESQAEAARALVAGTGWVDLHTVVDLAGRPRALVARHAGTAPRG